MTPTDTAAPRPPFDPQKQLRQSMVQAWEIPAGARVLEIGCGQGDTTVCLAEQVGSEGHITAIDAAGPDYGAPETLGAAIERIKTSELGRRIDFHLQRDILSAELMSGPFDYVVLAHSSWYFRSREQLVDTLAAATRYAPVLCLSEWELMPLSHEQFAHFLAAEIQCTLAAFASGYSGNIRLPLSRYDLSRLVTSAGWRIQRVVTLTDPGVQDGHWEVSAALTQCADFELMAQVPRALRPMLDTQADLLLAGRRQGLDASLSSYALTAEGPSKRPTSIN